MKNSVTTNVLLLIIAIVLIAIAAKPLWYPHPAQAQTQTQAQPDDAAPYPLYIEPGTQMLRAPDGTTQVYGRVMVDMQNGKIWGFPTTAMTVYPQDVSSPKPPVSHPFLLGTFAFEDTQK
jgi:hypothetical protein